MSIPEKIHPYNLFLKISEFVVGFALEEGNDHEKGNGTLFGFSPGNLRNPVPRATGSKDSRETDEEIRDRTGHFCSLYAGWLEVQ
jgi:hypothetical protein